MEKSSPFVMEDLGPESRENGREKPLPSPRQPAHILLAVLAIVFTLYWARAVFIPVMLSLMISYALSPLVNRLEKWRIPRAIGAAVLMLGIVGGLGRGVYSLSDEATSVIETLPDAAQKLRQTLRKERGTSESTMQKVQKAASQLERTASEAGVLPPSVPNGVTRVQIEKPKLNITDYFWQGTMGAMLVAGQASMVLFLAYFLLASGNMFRRKLVKISGSTLARKKITVQMLDEITSQIQRYLLVQVFTSCIVGVATWLAFLWIGLQHPAIWGVAACVFDTIPYLGPIIIFGSSALAGLFQFGTISMALLVGAISLLITGLEGSLLTPWLTGRASRMNAVVVFIGVLFWGWLWGPWGLLLGVPIIMIIKTVCDHMEDLKPIGELLGN